MFETKVMPFVLYFLKLFSIGYMFSNASYISWRILAPVTAVQYHYLITWQYK